MDIIAIKGAAALKVQELSALKAQETGREAEKASPEDFLNKTRKSLMCLLCHSDVADVTRGDLSALGGEEVVVQSIARAIVNLFGLAEAFGVDVTPELERFVAAEMKRLTGEGTEEEQPEAGSAGIAQQSEAGSQPAEAPQGSPATLTEATPDKGAVPEAQAESVEDISVPAQEAAVPGEPDKAGSGETLSSERVAADIQESKIVMYRRLLSAAVAKKAKSEIEKVWKTFTADRDPGLTGERFAFQKEKTEALKQLAA